MCNLCDLDFILVNYWFFEGTHAFLQTAVEMMFDRCFNISESNFITSVHELYLDLGAYGTAVIFVEDK